MRVDSRFRVFHNARYPYIDVRQPMDDLTELVEIKDREQPFILHPGEFVLGQTLEHVKLPDDLVGRLEGKSSLGRLGLLIHSTAGFVDSGFSGQPHARALERREPPDHDLRGHADRAALVHAHGRAGGAALRLARHGLEVPGPGGADAEPLLPQLQGQRGAALPWAAMWTPGPLEIVVVLVVVLVIFGPKRLPDLGRSLGTGMREFKDSVTGKDKEREELEAVKATAEKPEPTAAATPASASPSRGAPRGAPHPADRPR